MPTGRTLDELCRLSFLPDEDLCNAGKSPIADMDKRLGSEDADDFSDQLSDRWRTLQGSGGPSHAK